MKQYSILLLGCVLLLSACANQPHKAVSKNGKMDMLAVSRGLSNGAVDVYDPNAPLTMPAPPSQSNVYSSDTMSKDNSIPVKDPSVTIYDIDASAPAAPMPRIQAPSVAQYRSPFDPK